MSDPVPGFQDFMRPVLELLARTGRPMRAREAYEAVADELRLDAAARARLLPSGRQPVFMNRIGWASTYLRFAGLVHAPSRGTWAITDAGRAFLRDHTGRIDLRVLDTLPAYRESRQASEQRASVRAAGTDAGTPPEPAAATAEETLLEAHARLIDDVAEELAGHVDAMDPSSFEELVLDLLRRMGYGTAAGSSAHVGRAGDGGIDGIISLDRLGLEKVYVQAKKWDRARRVGRPEIQAFFGALAGQKGTKGLFMTTAAFTQDAIEYASNVSGSLILVDGARLVGLMIEHCVGVTTARTLAMPKIDQDYFEDA